MVRAFAFAIGIVALAASASAADPQKFASEENATKFCKSGNVVWYNPDSKIYFEPDSRFYGKTKQGGFTCRGAADKAGFKASKEK